MNDVEIEDFSHWNSRPAGIITGEYRRANTVMSLGGGQISFQFYCEKHPNRFQKWMLRKFMGMTWEILEDEEDER